MTKKTKKQKMLAALRRREIHLNPAHWPQTVKNQNDSASYPASVSPGLTYTIQKNIAVKPQNIATMESYSYVKHDLIKITIFTFSALIAQGVLYFVLNRG